MTDARRHPSMLVRGRRLEYRLLDPDGKEPWLVFLHEGLGSLGLWRDFPDAVIGATGHRGLVYSRYGHGWSDPLTAARPLSFMEEEAEVLADVLGELSIRTPILVGHSDGASIALIHAAAGHPVAGLVLLAPHVFVEPEGLGSIDAIRERFETGDLAARMAKHHADAAATFYGWNDVWLDPGFRGWNIESSLARITPPVLVIQGCDDEFGTVAQVDAITQGVSGPVEAILLEDCGHSPHLARPERALDAVAGFVSGIPEAG